MTSHDPKAPYLLGWNVSRGTPHLQERLMLRWICIYTQPHRERMAETSVARYGAETFLPLVKVARVQKGRPAEVPFFPRYLFAHVDLEVTPPSTIQWSAGVTSVVSFDERPVFLPGDVIDFIRARLAEQNGRGPIAMQPGERVRIKSGPFKDLEGIFERPASSALRVRVLLEVLGRVLPCELDAGAVVPLTAHL